MKARSRVVSLPVIAALILLAGCSLHQSEISRSTVQFPALFVEAGEKPEATRAPLGKWWETFGDDRLNSLMPVALGDNLDIAQAYARLAQFAATAQSVDASRLPFMNGAAQASRDQQQGISGPSRGTSYSLSLAAGFELDLWRKLKSRSEAARFNTRASRADIKALYITISAQLADLYFLTVEQRAQLELMDQIIATLTDTLTRVERRYREGLAPPNDVYQARQNLLSAKENRPQFQAKLAATLHAISLLMGRFPQQDIAGSVAQLPEAPAMAAPGLPAQLLNQRPDIEAAFLRLAAKDAEIAAAIADRLPAINLLANYGKARSAAGSFTSTGIFWDLIAEATAPILDGGRRRAEVTRNRAAFDEELARYKQTILSAVKEVEDALADNRADEERLKYLKARVLATGASLRLATKDYFEGLTDYLPVLIAQQLHFQTQSQVLAAKRQVLADRISLFRALGGTWQREMVENRLNSKKTQRDHS